MFDMMTGVDIYLGMKHLHGRPLRSSIGIFGESFRAGDLESIPLIFISILILANTEIASCKAQISGVSSYTKWTRWKKEFGMPNWNPGRTPQHRSSSGLPPKPFGLKSTQPA